MIQWCYFHLQVLGSCRPVIKTSYPPHLTSASARLQTLQTVTGARSFMAFHFQMSGSDIAITMKLNSQLLRELQSKREAPISPSSHGIYQACARKYIRSGARLR